MKPKTALHKKVVKLSATLRPITATQKQWAYSQCFEHIAYRGKNGSMVCSECAHEWSAEGKRGNKCRCQKCGAKLTVSHSLKRKSTQTAHFAVVTTRDNFQVIRVIYVKWCSRKGEKAEYIVNEALQRWFDAEGNEVNIARKKCFMPRYCDAWNFDSDMEIRSRTANYDNIPIYATYPKCRVLPIIRRNGFDGFHYTVPYDLLKGLMSDNKVETLVKTRQYGLLSYYLYRSQYRRDSWQLIRICLRHNYKVKDVTTWYDHINTLERLGMDIHNPLYLCPKNLRFKGIGTEKYGRPYYISVAEVEKIADFDLSANPSLAVQRDIFVFQCLIGCRVSDLMRMTDNSVIDGAVEYIPDKTKGERPEVLRVPLNQRAKDILERYSGIERKGMLLPFISAQKYNDAIKKIFTQCGINCIVTVLNPTTGIEEKRHINEIASSHLARRTFIGNIYKQVKDPNLVGALSGHKEGSKAFTRYRDIDEEMKQDLVNILG